MIGATWAYYAFNRLWQQSLSEESAAAMAEAVRLGLVRQPPVYGPRVVFLGTLSGVPVRLEWRGGLFGARTLLVRGGARQHIALLNSAQSVQQALGITEP
jgi:hypothetical protein